MPEYRECLAHYFLLQHLLSYYGYPSLLVQALWADASKSEEKSSGAQDGHVVQLENTCNWKRGNRGGQTPLFPPMFSSSKKNPNPPSVQTLELKNFSTTGRAITLNFNAAALQVCFLLISLIDKLIFLSLDGLSNALFSTVLQEGTMGDISQSGA